MEPMYCELNVLPLSGLHFHLPEADCSHPDVAINIEYCISDKNPDMIHCWAWAQINKASIPGLVEYDVPYNKDKDKLDESIIYTLNSSKSFRESLTGFIQYFYSLEDETTLS